MKSVLTAQLSPEALAIAFLQKSVGGWKSQRRYYTLKNTDEPQEVVSLLNVRFLEQGSPELIQLAQLHGLSEEAALVGGSQVSWNSTYTGKIRKPSQGSTTFGVLGNVLYRNQGFATTDPVIAEYYLSSPNTFCLKSEYGGSVFEEEIKLIGTQYRTRQTIISRAGQEQMIGQYLEKRIED